MCDDPPIDDIDDDFIRRMKEAVIRDELDRYDPRGTTPPKGGAHLTQR